MKFYDKHSFDKPADTVLKMFTDRAYFESKYQKLGHRNIEVLEHELDGNRFRITIRYMARTNAPVPDFAKKFMPSEMMVTQTDEWDITSRTGRLTAEIKGAPVKVSADMKVVDDGPGSANELSWNISCGIPLVGGKVEKVFANDIQAKSETDVKTSRELLAAY